MEQVKNAAVQVLGMRHFSQEELDRRLNEIAATITPQAYRVLMDNVDTAGQTYGLDAATWLEPFINTGLAMRRRDLGDVFDASRTYAMPTAKYKDSTERYRTNGGGMTDAEYEQVTTATASQADVLRAGMLLQNERLYDEYLQDDLFLGTLAKLIATFKQRDGAFPRRPEWYIFETFALLGMRNRKLQPRSEK
ncbi:MAG: hypothetical protein PHW10_03975 [Candidatus Peribacteraceae bacterium]|nr:hypothetical protein [Candidatus Peribacteraceae bacterium]